MNNDSSPFAKVFTILGKNNIHFYQVTTSKRTISFIVDKKDKNLAIDKLNESFVIWCNY